VAVDPPGCVGVPLDFQLLAELLVADRPAFPKEDLDLLADQGVALYRRGVVGLLVPDVRPDALGLFWRR